MFPRLTARLICAGLTALTVASTVAAQDKQKRPDPPKGYSWQNLEEARAAVLVPQDWHFSKSSNRDAVVYRVTKEKQSPFLTGLTVNVVRDVPKKTKVKPAIYAVKYVKDFIENVEVTEKPSVDKAGGMQRITCQVVKKLPKVDKEKLFRIRVTTMANDKTGTLYVMIFGSPKDEWDETYKIGKQLFNPIVLDTDF